LLRFVLILTNHIIVMLRVKFSIFLEIAIKKDIAGF